MKIIEKNKMKNRKSKLKTVLPASINTIQQAKKLLRELEANGESYHPEDDATDCLSHIATKEQGELLNKLMVDIYNLEGNNGNHANPVFDPCLFLLREREIFKVIDLTVLENDYTTSANDIWDMKAEVADELDEAEAAEIDQLLHFIETAEDGSEYQTTDKKYIRIK